MNFWKLASAIKELNMRSIYRHIVYVLSLCMLPLVSQAASINFDFTGRLVIADPYGIIIGSAYHPIEASLSYDTVTGVGNSDLSITMSNSYSGDSLTFHDISLTRQQDTNLIDGQGFVDVDVFTNIAFHVEWDATGLFNAIDYGLQVGDVLSGSTLYHDANRNGVQDTGEFIKDIYSSTPYSDTLQRFSADLQGPAPMAATGASIGISEGFYAGVRGYFDIGSGNSMHVTSVSPVPVPTAIWLFGSGLISLIGFSRRKKA